MLEDRSTKMGGHDSQLMTGKREEQYWHERTLFIMVLRGTKG